MPTRKTTKKKTSTKKRRSTKKASSKKTTRAAAKPKRSSVLEAAVTVLAATAPKAMSCGEMIKAIMKRRLWSTDGKTPAATLYSAILREIQKKGKQARFEKTERGRFRLRKGG